MAGLVKSVLFPQKSQSAKQQSAKQQQAARVHEDLPNASASLAKLKTSYGRTSHSSDEAADTPTGTLTPRPTLTDNRFPALKTHDDLGTAATNNNQTTKTPTTTSSSHHVLSPPYTPRGSSTTNDDVGGGGSGMERSGESRKNDVAMQTAKRMRIALGVTLGRLNVKILTGARFTNYFELLAQPYCICDFENTEVISKGSRAEMIGCG